jgi:hypothetical protein
VHGQSIVTNIRGGQACPPKEKQAARSLLSAGADVIAQHQDTPSALLAASDAGMWGIGCESHMRRFAPKVYLIGTTWTWGPFVTRMISVGGPCPPDEAMLKRSGLLPARREGSSWTSD